MPFADAVLRWLLKRELGAQHAAYAALQGFLVALCFKNSIRQSSACSIPKLRTVLFMQ